MVRMSLDLPDETQMVPLCRRVTRTVLRDLGVEASRADEIELAVSEATGNVVRHAYEFPGQRFRFTLEVLVDRVRLQVVDHGRGFVRGAVTDPDEERLGGRGIWLIEQLANLATISTLPGGGCRLEAEFGFPPPDSDRLSSYPEGVIPERRASAWTV